MPGTSGRTRACSDPVGIRRTPTYLGAPGLTTPTTLTLSRSLYPFMFLTQLASLSQPLFVRIYEIRAEMYSCLVLISADLPDLQASLPL